MRHEASSFSLSEYTQLKRSFEIPLKIRLYLSNFEAVFENKHCLDATKRKMVEPMLIDIFGKQTERQMIAYMDSLIKGIKLHFDTHNQHGIQNTNRGIAHVETSAQMQTFYFGWPRWSTVRFKLQKSKKQCIVTSKKKIVVMNLQHYFMRKSKKHKYSMVFQAISKDVSQQLKRVCLCFQENVYDRIYSQVISSVYQIRIEQVLKLAKLDSDQSQQQDPGESQNAILTSVQITSYLKYKQNIISSINTNHLNFKRIWYVAQSDVEICRSGKQDKLFRVQFFSEMSVDKFKPVFLQCLNRFKYRVESSQLQDFSKKYKAVFDSYLISGHRYEQISIKQQCVDGEIIHFSQGVETVMTSLHIEFMMVRARPTMQQKTRVQLFCNIKTDTILTQRVIINFLMQYAQMTSKHLQTQGNLQDQQFFSILAQNNGILVQFQQSDEQYNHQYDEMLLHKQNTKNSLKQSYLSCRYAIQPIQMEESQLRLRIIKEHFLVKEFARCKNGGLMCIRANLAEQRKKLRKVAASIGSNLFKLTKNGVMNISLPVLIFKKQSHLQIVANNYSYAPILFDRFKQSQDYLQRFKACILFTISVINLGIASQKPFNPILGQTMQGFIGGCPIYVQQISHHPPISAFYFKGRHFVIHGTIQAKVGFYSLNSAKCWSQKPTVIEFDDGTVVYLSNPKMIIKGLIFGDREFHYQDKNYVYDTKNHYFAELNFGPKKKGFYYRSAQPQDYVHGKIYRTTTAYLSKFKQKMPPIFPTKQDIAVQLCNIQGIWNQGISFDGKQLFNFSVDLPYKLQYQQNPLPSHSLFRKDLKYYIDGDNDKAQEHKELMEQMQRRDRKLREQGVESKK